MVIKYYIYLSHCADFIVFGFTSAVLSPLVASLLLFYCSGQTWGEVDTYSLEPPQNLSDDGLQIGARSSYSWISACLKVSYSKAIQQEPTYVQTSFYFPILLFLFFIFLLHAYLCCLLRTWKSTTNYAQQEEGTLRHPYLRVIVFTQQGTKEHLFLNNPVGVILGAVIHLDLVGDIPPFSAGSVV